MPGEVERIAKGLTKARKHHRYLIRKNGGGFVGSTDDLGVALPSGYRLIDTVGEDGLGPCGPRYLKDHPNGK